MLKCKKIPFMLIVGEEEEKTELSIRRHGQKEKETSVTIEEFAEIGRRDQKKTLKTFTV
jgi:threonyl-tRNA synthetase